MTVTMTILKTSSVLLQRTSKSTSVGIARAFAPSACWIHGGSLRSSSSLSSPRTLYYQRQHQMQTTAGSGIGVDGLLNHQRSVFFSTKAKSNLLDILAREEAEEHELGNTTMPDELADLKATIEKDWRIVEAGALTEMFRTLDNGLKVQVSFHCQDTIEDDVFDDLNDEEGVDGDDEEEQSSPVRFTATVSKAGKTLTLACYTEHGFVKVDGVSTTHLAPQSVHETMGTLPKVEYQGPSYDELSEDLQEAFETYLEEECGVTEDVAAFVAMFSDFREETLYVSFLKEAQSIIS